MLYITNETSNQILSSKINWFYWKWWGASPGKLRGFCVKMKNYPINKGRHCFVVISPERVIPLVLHLYIWNLWNLWELGSTSAVSVDWKYFKCLLSNLLPTQVQDSMPRLEQTVCPLGQYFCILAFCRTFLNSLIEVVYVLQQHRYIIFPKSTSLASNICLQHTMSWLTG